MRMFGILTVDCLVNLETKETCVWAGNNSESIESADYYPSTC